MTDDSENLNSFYYNGPYIKAELNSNYNFAAITFRNKDGSNQEYGSYEYGMPVEDMLKSDIPLVKAMATCIRDAYEAGLRGDKIPMRGDI